MEKNEEYLGDGVYAIFDGRGIWLHANDRTDPTDKVYLEPEVLASLFGFAGGFYNVLGSTACDGTEECTCGNGDCPSLHGH